MKKFGVASLVMSILIPVIDFIDAFVLTKSMFGPINSILFIAVAVCGYMAFKDTVSFKSKWIWPVAVVFLSKVLEQASELIARTLMGFDVVSGSINILLFAGTGLILASILFGNYKKIMPIGFGVFALGNLICILAGKNAIYSAGFAVAVLFALILLDRTPRFNKLFRTVIVLLSLIMLVNPAGGALSAVSYIIFAIILVPIEKPKLNIAIILIVLCVITAILTPVAILKNGAFSAVKNINAEITNYKNELASMKTIEAYEAEIAESNKKIEAAELEKSSLSKEKHEADDALDEVCSRSYYSSWGGCDDTCYELHKAVSKVDGKISSQNSIINDEEEIIEECNNSINRINEINECIKGLTAERRGYIVKAMLLLVAMVIAVAGLIALIIFLYKGGFGVLACAMLAVASIIFMTLLSFEAFEYWNLASIDFRFLLVVVANLVTSPYLWSIAILAMLYAIISKEEKLVRYRVFTIIFAVILVLIAQMIAQTNMAEKNLVTLFAVTMACIALYLVPCRFTEYNNIAKHLFFSIITGGIWLLIWTYNVTGNLNKVAGVNRRKPAIELLLCIFLPFYYIFWLFKTAEAVEVYGAENGKQFKFSIIGLVLAIVLPIFATVLIQDKINLIVGKSE